MSEIEEEIPEEIRCPTCNIIVPEARAELGYLTCVKHSDEKPKDHKPGVVDSLGRMGNLW